MLFHLDIYQLRVFPRSFTLIQKYFQGSQSSNVVEVFVTQKKNARLFNLPTYVADKLSRVYGKAINTFELINTQCRISAEFSIKMFVLSTHFFFRSL